MKKIDFTNPGGLDISIDDLMFIYNALHDGVVGSLNWLDGLTTNNCVIISGCVITVVGSNYTYTSGWVWKDGNIYFVPAQAVPQSITLTYFVFNFIENEVISAGTQTAEDSSTANTYLQSYATIIRSAVSAYQVTDDIRYGEVLKTAQTEEGWQTPSFSNNWTGSLKYKLNRFGEVEFIGSTSCVSITAGQQEIMVLPTKYRPTEDKYFLTSSGIAGDSLLIKVATTGSVSVVLAIYGGNQLGYLHNIRFRKS